MRKFRIKESDKTKRKLAHIITFEGSHLLVMPDGTEVPGVRLTRVTDEEGCVNVAMVQLYVNISEGELLSDD